MLAVMFLLLALTVWVVDQRITLQMEAEAKRTLGNAARTFHNRQEIRMKELLARPQVEIARRAAEDGSLRRGDGDGAHARARAPIGCMRLRRHHSRTGSHGSASHQSSV